MAGTAFSYVEGYIRVTFRPAVHGDIDIDLRIYADGVTQTQVGDQWDKVGVETSLSDDLHVIAATSPTTSAFFKSLLAWLEAVICGVYECSFIWEDEGPEGRLSWLNHHDNRGVLHLTWDGSRQDSTTVDRRVLLNRTQMVRAFYAGMRDMVTAPDYCRLDNEPVSIRDCVEHVLSAEDQAGLLDALATMARRDATTVLDGLLNFAYNKECGSNRQSTLAVFTNLVAHSDAEMKSVDESVIGCWFAPEWEQWSISDRRRHLEGTVYGFGAWFSPGEAVSTMRSERIEAWLSEHNQSRMIPQMGCATSWLEGLQPPAAQ